MTRQEVDQKLDLIGKNFVRVFADSDKVVYVPEHVAKVLRQDGSLKEITDDTFFGTLRHQNNGTAMVAFQY